MNVPRFLRRLFRRPYDGYRHFAVVDEGVLYRCGQPTPEQLAEMIRTHGLKTVISFRGSRNPSDPDDWEVAERAACAANAANFVSIPCNHRNPPTPAQVEQFLSIMRDPAQRPALVHCRLGQQRTMMFVALYWVHIRGMDPAAAETAMDEAGFNIRHRRHQELLAAFRALAQPTAASAAP